MFSEEPKVGLGNLHDEVCLIIQTSLKETEINTLQDKYWHNEN